MPVGTPVRNPGSLDVDVGLGRPPLGALDYPRSVAAPLDVAFNKPRIRRRSPVVSVERTSPLAFSARRRWWHVSLDWLLPGILFLAAFVGHVVLARAMAGPTIQTDEVGYLGEANLFGHGVGLLYQTVPYHPGYGFLLAPVAALTSAPGVLYRAGLLLNALASGALAVAAYLLARRVLPGRVPWACAAVGALVSCYPAFVGFGNVATEASVFIAVCTFSAVAVGWAAAGDLPIRWAVAGFLAGACFCLHPIGPAAVAGVLAASLFRQPGVRRLSSVASTVVGAQATVALTIVLNRRIVHYTTRHLLNPGPIPPGFAAHSQVVVSRSQNLLNTYTHPTGNLTAMLYEAAGQSWYLAVATGGLVVLGAGFAIRSTWRVTWANHGRRAFARPIRGARAEAGDAVGVFVAVLAAAGFVTSVHHWLLGANGGPQADMLIYGRFNEHLLAPLLVLGLCELRGLGRVRARVAVAWAAGACALIASGGLLIQHGRTATALRRPTVTFNVLGIQPVLARLGFINVALISVLGCASLVIAIMLAAEWGLLVVTPLAAAAWLAIGLSGAHAIIHDSEQRAVSQRVVLHALDLVEARVGLQRCVGYDRTVETQWTIDTDQLFMPRTMMHPFDSAVRERPCSPVVISNRLDLFKDYPGARLMAAENFEATRLWILPGIAQYQLAIAGLLLPEQFPAALPDTAFRSNITPLVDVPKTVAAGATISLPVMLRNAGRGSPWPTRFGLGGAKTGWVAIVAGWTAQGAPAPQHRGEAIGQSPRTDLPTPLWPGELVRDVLVIHALDDHGRPLAPGPYVLHVELVQEGFRFFVDQADRPLDIAVTVVG